MTTRNRLPNRRRSENFNLKVGGQGYVATVGFDPNDKATEIFLNATKIDSAADINAADGAVAVSIALQYGASIKTLRDAMKRNADGSAQGPLGAALDRLLK
jgi:ribonucleoside-diphosphate reductase alpha chain